MNTPLSQRCRIRIVRLPHNPIITPDMDERMGSNINGPSLIKVPEWVKNPLGRYYLYFAHHQGEYIRLAYADHIAGPWTVHAPGTLTLEQSYFPYHIASPDVHIDNDKHAICMYYHGCSDTGQYTRAATSPDGLRFTAHPEILGNPYFRVFFWRGCYYALGMPGVFYRSADGLTGFEQGPTLFTEHMRHSAVMVDGDTLTVFYTNAYDCPERILCSTVALQPDWEQWTASEPVTVLEPEMEYEGADLPLEASERGAVHTRARQLRDPAIYREGANTYLLYSVAGEHGIALAELEYHQ